MAAGIPATGSSAADALAAPWAQKILAILPLLLFMPQGWTNGAMLIYLLVLLASGSWRAKLDNVAAHPMLRPVLVMLGVSVLAGLALERPADFWSGFVHYQVYVFLLLFMAAGAGPWQEQAVRNFFLGATLAAITLCLGRAGLLPQWGVFASYIAYSGNKSILLGILLAVAASWMLHDIVNLRQRHWLRVLQMLFVATVLLVLARTRTGAMIFLVCGMGILLANWRLSWRSLLIGAVSMVAMLAALQAVPAVSARLAGTMADARSFASGGQVSADGVRLGMYRATLDLIADKPLTGHGIGTWIEHYRDRIKGTEIPMHSTPHNDYLLYLSEMGMIGLAALLGIWAVQMSLVRQLAQPMSGRLVVLCAAMAIGTMFNALLRDFVFALPFMLLLSIPLAGLRRAKAVTP